MHRRQQGYALLIVMMMLSAFIISLAAALPNWRTSIERDHENQEIDRARDFRTGIKRYFHKYGRYPGSVDMMTQVDGQGLRYLRENWQDPLNSATDTGSSSDNTDQTDANGGFRLLHYGEAVQAQVVDQLPAAAMGGSSGSNSGAGNGLGPGNSPAGAGGSIGGAGIGGAQAGGPTTGAPGTGPGLGAAGSGQGSGMYGSGTSSGTSGGTGPIIGVASFDKSAAVHVFNGFDTPNDWQFVYDPSQDPSLRAGGATQGGAGAGRGATPVAGGAPVTIPH